MAERGRVHSLKYVAELLGKTGCAFKIVILNGGGAVLPHGGSLTYGNVIGCHSWALE